MTRNAAWVGPLLIAVYLIGWNRGAIAGTTYTRDAWTRAVRRDADAVER